jgi:SAM-dependent methyltransferase
MGNTERYRQRMQHATRARVYADRFQTGRRRVINAREQRAVAKIFAGLKDVQVLVDVPSGAGRFIKVLADGRRLIEADVAFEILQFACERAEEAQLQIACVQSDASRLPLGDESVDAVFCNRLLHHIHSAAERALFLREFHRVTRKYLVMSFFDYHSFGGLRRFFKALKGRKPKYHQHPTLAEFTEEVKRCGFRMREVVLIGPVWVAQKYLVLEKTAAPGLDQTDRTTPSEQQRSAHG